MFPSGVAAEFGNVLTPTAVKDEPEVHWDACPKRYYTLYMTDPDAPSRTNPKFREFQHWLVTNIPGNDVLNGETLSEFVSSGPAFGSGLHRYVFLVYQQPRMLVFDEERLSFTSPANRDGFSIKKFARKYNLGGPIAGNLYQAQYDDFVPMKYLQIYYSRIFSRAISSVTQAFEANGVVPDVVAEAPAAPIAVKFPSGVVVEFGNELTPTEVKDAPAVQWKASPTRYYTLCMTDPDAPSRKEPTFREWHHWLVGNVPGNDVSKGETLSAYVGSGPLPKTGLHRYVYLVYEQPGKLSFDEPRLPNTSGDKRGGFSIAKFARKYKLGEPIAGNLYQAQYDDYVPLLYKQLGAKASGLHLKPHP